MESNIFFDKKDCPHKIIVGNTAKLMRRKFISSPVRKIYSAETLIVHYEYYFLSNELREKNYSLKNK
jgi:hypothetical protein